LSPEDVHPEDFKNLTPLEFASKHGHVHVQTATDKEVEAKRARYFTWTADVRTVMKDEVPDDLLDQYMNSVGSKQKWVYQDLCRWESLYHELVKPTLDLIKEHKAAKAA
jgi:hypothetical protein